jgi:hypothetical protein
MFKPLIFSLTLVIALGACSKKDDAASSASRAPPANAVSAAPDAARDTADAPAQKAAPLDSASELPAKEAATSTEAVSKKHKKQAANGAHDSAKSARSSLRRQWHEFQAMVDRCDTATSAAREECLTHAKDTYRSANFKCDALAAPQRKNCLEFAERLTNTTADAPTAAIKHDKEPMTTAPAPGDPRPAERNRDSTKQNQDAVGTPPDPTKPN